MKHSSLKPWFILTATLLSAALSSCVHGEYFESNTTPPPVLAVFPFANLTESGGALIPVMPACCDRIAAQGLSCITDKELRPLLRRYRIRSGGMLMREDVRLIGEQTGATALLLGSIDFFREGKNPELGLSVRILDVNSLEVLFARSRALTGADFAGLFGIGMVDSVADLVTPLIASLLEGVGPERLRAAHASRKLPAGPTLALVSFEDRSDYPMAGEIYTRILFSELFETGFHLLDPVLLNAIYVKERRAPSGSVDLPIVAGMRVDLGADWILTGCVSLFEPSTGEALSAPSLETHARMLNARSGRLVFKFDDKRFGSPSAQVLRFEESRSLGRLAAKSAASLCTRITRKIDDELEQTQ